MKRKVSIVFFIIVFTSLSALVYGQEGAIVQQQLDTQYKKLAEAYERET